MIRYLVTAILMVMVMIVVIIMISFILNTLYLANSVSNYAVVIENGTCRLLGIP
ncbi:hypothetical protein [Vulcanisaeta souniana]|uniref:Uncharacterized protein n=1 Tax=Vulcanisaeta souniana JCM 11219 TaxID=1293586 RepID=A0A830EHG6_9CREN|nr:hypothetical protein [Vulcanisaeta souniana]BDR93042.1 hypothetical protein Vsou_21350 [Vulcanisaeta souniana JCM 11219]GGI83330.1 hypothetical protein GCM10007112_20200 [Vulcanisaeta souniana JCM 11219]